MTKAVLNAAAGAAPAYVLQIVQAAAQTFAWVASTNTSGTPNFPLGSVSFNTSATTNNVVYDIAEAVANKTSDTLQQLMNAAYFGIQEAVNGTISAGALGLNATGLNSENGSLVVNAAGNSKANFYLHYSATGVPVTDIFNL